MSALQDYGIENPVKTKKERYYIQTVTTYTLFDSEKNEVIDLSVDFTGSGQGYKDMEEKKKELEKNKGE